MKLNMKNKGTITKTVSKRSSLLCQILAIYIQERGERERSVSEKNNMVGNNTLEWNESVLRWHLSRNLDVLFTGSGSNCQTWNQRRIFSQAGWQ